VRNIFKKEFGFFYYLLLLFAIIILPFWIFDGRKSFLFSIFSVTTYIIVAELLFRTLYKLRFKKPYKLSPKLPIERMYVEPHPYLPYVYKKNFLCRGSVPATYPLNRDKGYMLGEAKTNNFGYSNGPMGNRDIKMPKPENLIRINCIGASETGNYIRYANKEYSYPMELESILHNVLPEHKIEVNNCGQGAYTSAAILTRFLLDTIDTKPDIIVFYHGYNDLWPFLTEGFKSDYSHARRNLGEVYNLYKFGLKIPNIPLASWNFLINNTIFGRGVRFTLLNAITRKRADVNNDFKGLDTYKRNIEHLINICKANNIYIILSTFCHYLYDDIKSDRKRLKYDAGIKLENEIIKEVASKHNVPLVDSELLIPKEDRYFMDSIHFSPDGMKLFAELISRPIIDQVARLTQKSYQ